MSQEKGNFLARTVNSGQKHELGSQILHESLKDDLHESEIRFRAHARHLGVRVYGCKLRKGYTRRFFSIFLSYLH